MYTPTELILDDFNTGSSPEVSHQMRLRDMFTRGSGLRLLIYYVVGKEGNVFAKHSDVLHVFNNLPEWLIPGLSGRTTTSGLH